MTETKKHIMMKKLLANTFTNNVVSMSMNDFVAHISQHPTDTYVQLNNLLQTNGPDFSFKPYMEELNLAKDEIAKLCERFESMKPLGEALIQDAKNLIDRQAPFYDTYYFLQKAIEFHTRIQNAENVYLNRKEDIGTITDAQITQRLDTSPIQTGIPSPFMSLAPGKRFITKEDIKTMIEEKKKLPFFNIMVCTSACLEEKNLLHCGGIMLEGFLRERINYDNFEIEEFTSQKFAGHDIAHALVIWNKYRQKLTTILNGEETVAERNTKRLDIYKQAEDFSKAAEKYSKTIADENTRLAAELILFTIGHEGIVTRRMWDKSLLLSDLNQHSEMIRIILLRAQPSHRFAYSSKYKTPEVYAQIETARGLLLKFVKNYSTSDDEMPDIDQISDSDLYDTDSETEEPERYD